jgi:putative hydrolase of the HAD superfamily
MKHLSWERISTVFLDMDGTLLDLHYDTHFWLGHVPWRYAEKHGLTFDEARARLMQRYEAKLGTMEWYSVEYWTRELEMDITSLKQEVTHLISVHPHVNEFLTRLRERGKRVVLLTNAHRISLDLKMRHTGLESFFDAIICAHDLGVPKENPDFWGRLQGVEAFLPQHTLLVDDSLPVLRSARNYGIAWLLAVKQPDSRQRAKDTAEFPALESFASILP